MFDAHLHLRDGEMLSTVAPYSFGRCIIMPNVPEILTESDASRYKEMIIRANGAIEPLMMLKMHKGIELSSSVVGVKIYPRGVTTGSDNGITVTDMVSSWAHGVYAEMEKRGMVLSIHPEAPLAFCLDREVAILPVITEIAEAHGELRIVVEHITDARTIYWMLDQREGVAATITPHHLYLTLDNVVGKGKLQKDNYCAPIAKFPRDMEQLRMTVLSGDSRFFLGTDSAPHTVSAKNDGCAGVFSAPVALPLVYELLGDRTWDFVNTFAAQFYRMESGARTFEMIEESWRVPSIIGGVVPFMAGEEMRWKVRHN